MGHTARATFPVENHTPLTGRHTRTQNEQVKSPPPHPPLSNYRITRLTRSSVAAETNQSSPAREPHLNARPAQCPGVAPSISLPHLLRYPLAGFTLDKTPPSQQVNFFPACLDMACWGNILTTNLPHNYATMDHSVGVKVRCMGRVCGGYKRGDT